MADTEKPRLGPYRVDWLGYHSDDVIPELEDRLNEIAAEGWEMVSVEHRNSTPSGDYGSHETFYVVWRKRSTKKWWWKL